MNDLKKKLEKIILSAFSIDSSYKGDVAIVKEITNEILHFLKEEKFCRGGLTPQQAADLIVLNAELFVCMELKYTTEIENEKVLEMLSGLEKKANENLIKYIDSLVYNPNQNENESDSDNS